MKRLAILLAIPCMSCNSASLVGRYSPQAAKREAGRDIASGHMKVYLAGEDAAFEVGVTPGDHHLVEHLPQDHSLPTGRTVPHAAEATVYAETYNRAIIRYLRIRPNS